MPNDPRKMKTLGEASSNENGTYNGFRALSWLSEALSPGKGLSVEEVKQIVQEVKSKREQRTGS